MKSLKKVVLGPRFVGEGDTPNFGHAFSNRTHFRALGRFGLSSVQRARGVADEKEEESVVKPKSADYSVRRPKYLENGD